MMKRYSILAALLFVLCYGHAPHVVHADPVNGQWALGPVWPIYPVHLNVLPTKKVMFFSGNNGISGDDSTLWDPATNTITTLAQAGYDIFCAGHAYAPNGLILMAGGNIDSLTGLPYASYYNPYSNVWTRLPDMNGARWYPTTITLANGDFVTLSGYMDPVQLENPLAQVWQYATGTWRDLTNALRKEASYAWLHVAPNGKVFMSGPKPGTRYLDTSGTGAWTFVAQRQFDPLNRRNYGSSVMYDQGKVIVIGGHEPPTNTAEVIDLSQTPDPVWRYTGAMAFARRHLNATLLADGKVLVTGGTSGPGFNDTSSPVLASELWDPATETWTTVASQSVGRFYHSVAALLPDGRVISGGGDFTMQTEIYSPPYLFKGPRPSITNNPSSTTYGESVFIGTPQATSIAKVHLIRLPSVTHAFDHNQRINRLTFSQTPGGLTVTTPANGNLAPPGHYMLFILDGAGVPSVSSIVALRNPDGGAPKAPSGLTTTAISNSQIDLMWADSANNETQFLIERSADGVNFTQINTVPKNIVMFSDTGLAPNTTYFYRVRAGNGSGNSSYSNISSKKTLA